MQQETQESKSELNDKKERLTAKKNQLIASKAELLKQVAQVDQQIELLRKTTNKDDISEFYASLEQEIVKMSKEIGFVSTDRKHITALQLLKDIEKNIEEQLRFLKEYKEDKEKQPVIRNL